MSPLDALIEARAFGFMCAASRISGLVAVAPLPWVVAPMRARAALVLFLSLAAAVGPAEVASRVMERPLLMAVAVLGELALGAAIGFTIRLVIASAEMAADIIGPQLGIGVAQLFDPKSQVSETPIGSLFRHLAILLAVIAGLHREALAVLFQSFELLPTGALVNAGRLGPLMLALVVGSVEAGVRIAAPVVAVLFMVQVGLAFIARAAPAMQIFAVGFAVTLAVGAVVLIATLPDTASMLLAEISRFEARARTLLEALTEAPP